MSTSEGSSADQAIDTDRAQQRDGNSETTHVDPDTEAGLPNSKRPRLELAEGKKVRVLTALIEAYGAICKNLKFTEEMLNENLTTSHQVTIIMSSLHNICRSKINANTITTPTTYTVNADGKLFTNTSETLLALWTKTLESNGLEYRVFAADCDNWFGTMSAYLNSSETFRLRLNELRLGYRSMPVTSEDGSASRVSLSEYGLSERQYCLLEGTTYSPERRLVMKHSVGAMTAFLCMIQSEGKYRKKWEEIVKRSMSLISCIDDIIEITKEKKSGCEVSIMVKSLAEIMLLTIPEHPTRMHFPMCMLYRIHAQTAVEHRVALLKRFSCSGPGGFYFYKQCQPDTLNWVIEGNYTAEQAAQLVFHAILGTFKEELTILEQITDVNKWFTHDQFRECFKKTEGATAVRFTLPQLRLYPKVSAVKQTDLLTTNVTGLRSIRNNRQMTSVPVFSGFRIRTFSQDFLDHIQGGPTEPPSTAGNMDQIEKVLDDTLRKRERKVKENKSNIDTRTTTWRTMASLTATEDGTESQDTPVAGRRYFRNHSINPYTIC